MADKLDVSIDALLLWCLRLSTDRFWSIITDNSDPTKNSLEEEVRYWTSRCRIRFKNDVSLALVNAMMQASAIREGKNYRMKELTIQELYKHLQNFYFVGVDPSGLHVMDQMKARWNNEGRTSTHYYQGFREIRWETLAEAIIEAEEMLVNTTLSWNEKTKRIFSKISMRDGFKIGGSFHFLVEDWNTASLVQSQAIKEATEIIESGKIDTFDINRLRNLKTVTDDSWLQDPGYSPTDAEYYREKALSNLKKKFGGQEN